MKNLQRISDKSNREMRLEYNLENLLKLIKEEKNIKGTKVALQLYEMKIQKP